MGLTRMWPLSESMLGMWKISTRIVRLVRDELGQATAEYVIATGAAVIAAYYVLITFHRWLAWYYYDAAALVSLPLP